MSSYAYLFRYIIIGDTGKKNITSTLLFQYIFINDRGWKVMLTPPIYR